MMNTSMEGLAMAQEGGANAYYSAAVLEQAVTAAGKKMSDVEFEHIGNLNKCLKKVGLL